MPKKGSASGRKDDSFERRSKSEMNPDFGIFLVGKQGRRQGIDEKVFEDILRLTRIERKVEYSKTDTRLIEEAVRDAVKHEPYNRQTTKVTMLFLARFFKTCGGFTVEPWRPPPRKHSNRKPSTNPKIRTISETIERRLREMGQYEPE